MREILEVEGPFSLPLMLANVRRRPNEIIDVADEQRYYRLLEHRERALLLTVATVEGNSQKLRLDLLGLSTQADAEDYQYARTVTRRLFSLDASPQRFYDLVQRDAVLGPVTRALYGLRPLGSATIFEMLMVAILGQQISMAAAGAIKSRLVRSLGSTAAVDGRIYYAFPSPEKLAVASPEDLIALAFSQRKAEYVGDIARMIAIGDLDLERLRGQPHAEILERLLAIRGIGRWTAEYVLLRGYGYPDALPVGDAGLRRQIAHLYGLATPPSEQAIASMGAAWAPYRSWATLYLWNAGLTEDAGLLSGQ